MAQIVLDIEEIAKLISGFVRENKRIAQVSTEDSLLKFKINTPGILPSVTVAMEFNEFRQGKAIFRLQANPLIKLIIEFFDLPATEWLQITASHIVVDVNRLIESKKPNIRISDIRQPDVGKFLIDVHIL